MTDSPRPDGASTSSGAADPTRDIRLPAMADRPPSVLPRAWSGLQPAPESASRAGDGVAANVSPSADLQTDDLQAPRPHRDRTISFASPEAAVGRRSATVGRKPRPPHRWPWVVLALLPVLVIVVSGVWWFLLLRAA